MSQDPGQLATRSIALMDQEENARSFFIGDEEFYAYYQDKYGYHYDAEYGGSWTGEYASVFYKALERDQRLEQKFRAEAFMNTLAQFRAQFRAKLKLNLRPARKSWRYLNIYNPLIARNDNKELGKQFALALQNEDISACKACLDSIASIRYADIFDRFEFLNDAFTFCDRCGALEWNADTYEVHTSRRRPLETEMWCDSCAHDYAFVCDDCGDWWHCDHSIDAGCNSICPSCYSENYFTCDGCGNVYHNDRYAGDGYCEDCYNGDDEDDEDDEDEYAYRRDGLKDYHCGERNFVTHNDTPSYPFNNAPPMGVELEVYANGSRRDAVTALRCLTAPTDPTWPGSLILERDGSLDSSSGFEIITDPMGLKEHQQHTPALLKCLKDNDVVGWDATGGRYGIHITIHRGFLSPLQEARMMMFLCADMNQRFVQAIAQRPDIYSAQLSIGCTPQRQQTIRTLGNLSTRYASGKDYKKICGVGKYAPINFKTHLAEFRIFQSTTHPQSYLKNLEFVAALVEWTRPVSATGSKWFYRDFLQWFKQRPLARQHYPNLVGYLDRQYHPVKGVGKQLNEWRDYVPRQTLNTPEIEAEEATTC